MRVHRLRWLALGLAVLAILNVWQSATIEWGTDGKDRVLARAEGERLLDLAQSSTASPRLRFGPYLELRPFAAGGTVVVPATPATFQPSQLRGLAGADHVRLEYDARVDPALADGFRMDAGFTSSLRTSRGDLPVFGPRQAASVLVVLVDEAEESIFVVAADDLHQRGVTIAGLALDELADGRSLDG
jgi:hypothetical protein